MNNNIIKMYEIKVSSLGFYPIQIPTLFLLYTPQKLYEVKRPKFIFKVSKQWYAHIPPKYNACLEKGSDQLFVFVRYKYIVRIVSQSVDPNLFRGTAGMLPALLSNSLGVIHISLKNTQSPLQPKKHFIKQTS